MTQQWTSERPTKPGRYLMSLHPDTRPQGFRSRMEVEVGAYPRWMLDHDMASPQRDERVMAVAYGFDRMPRGELADPFFDGALWLPYVEPPDPHASPQPTLRSRIEALPDLVLDSGRVIGGAVDRGAVLALLDEVTG